MSGSKPKARTKTHLGVKYKLVYTGVSRWSNGKEHLAVWSKEGRGWSLLCNSNGRGWSGLMPYNTSDIPPEPPEGGGIVQCLRCAPMIERVFGL